MIVWELWLTQTEHPAWWALGDAVLENGFGTFKGLALQVWKQLLKAVV